MKRLSTTIMLLISIIMLSYGKHNATTRYFNVECEEQWQTNTILIEDNDTCIYSINLIESLGVYKRWSVSGNIVIFDTSATSAKFYSNGPIKGRIYYYFDDDPSDSCKCGLGSVSIDVYKHFDAAAKYGVEIIGPDCIADGDSVVFSINPILTANLYSGIGMDLYNWNIFNSSSAPYVKSIPYVSGDSSSVTFTVDKMTGNDSITIRVGLANEEYRIVKYLGKAAPKPIVHDTCLPYNQKSFEVNIFNEEYPDLVYSWEYDSKWATATFPDKEGNQTKKYCAVLHPDSCNVGTITVTASYGNDDACVSASKASFNLYRSWGTDANVSISKDCAHNGGDSVHFELSKDKVPDGVAPIWELPDGWEAKTDAENYRCDYDARPINSTKYIDTIKVWANSCSKKDSCLAIVHIAPARVDSITNLSCLKSDSIYTFKVERLGRGPAPTGYQWYINGTEVGGPDSIFTHKFTSGMTSLAVRSLGENGCHADSTQIALTFQPTPPDSMSISNTCLFTGQNDTTTCIVHNRKSNYVYMWTYPQGWREVTSLKTDSSITLITDGRGGTKRVGVFTSSASSCGVSDTLWTNMQIDTTSYEIQYSCILGSLHVFTLKDNIINQDAIANWKIDGIEQPNSQHSSFTFQQQLMPNIVTAEITRPNGCVLLVTWRKQGMLLSKSAQSQIMARTRVEQTSNTDEFTLYPNPAKDIITLHKETDEHYKVFIFDMNGTLIKSVQMYENVIHVNVSDMPDGNYFAVFTNGVNHNEKKFFLKH